MCKTQRRARHFRDLIIYYINEDTKRFAENVIKEAEVSGESADKIRQKAKEVSQQIYASMAKELKAIDQLHKDTFTIPANVLLPDDEEKDKTANEDETALIKKCDTLTMHFKQNGMLLHSLRAEKTKFQNVQALVDNEEKIVTLVDEALMADCSFIEHKPATMHLEETFKKC